MDNYGGNSWSYVSIHVFLWPLMPILPVTQGWEIEPVFMEISFNFFLTLKNKLSLAPKMLQRPQFPYVKEYETI